MSDNVIKFRKPTPPKKPRPGLKKVLILLAVVGFFVAVWAWFAFIAPRL